ncbi:MAG: signal peptidase II [Anaerolineales bacterium]|nr:signal peptidase II [Anaerolineales bacterium]
MKGELPISKPTTSLLPQTGGPLPTIIGVAAITFALDQATKFLVVKNIPLWSSWSLYPAIDRLFKLTFITNTGAAFGMFPQLGTVFMGIAFIVITGIIAFHHQLPTENVWIRLCLGLQLGGAMGNLLDRLIRGYVVDFVDIGFWPIFNIADISIVLGVTILAYHLWNTDEHLDSAAPGSSLSKGNGL